MEYRTTANAWDERVSAIASTADPDMLPPLILEYVGDSLRLCDGNHRHEALRRRGATTAWALVWCNTASAFADASSQLARDER